MKKYTVMIIGESGNYETVASNVSGKLAGSMVNHYRAKGVWAQAKEEERKMTRREFIKRASKFCNKEEAIALANDYTDEEIREHGKEIIKDLAEEYRHDANVSRYRNRGY